MFAYIFILVVFFSACSHQAALHRHAGRALGQYKVTVYWLAKQARYDDQRTIRSVRLYSNRQVIAHTSEKFARMLRMQGSGILLNGRLVQYAGLCKSRPLRNCMRVTIINRKRFPMSVGAWGKPLIPLRSISVDTRRIAFGSKIYIPQLQHWLRKRGVAHNGCFIAHDRGGGIRGARIDLFVGTRKTYYRTLGKNYPRSVRLYLNHPNCKHTT